MYWTDWHDSASILRANMDGSNVTILLQNHSIIRKPKGLVIDFLEDMIYWTDEENNYIARAMIDGTGLEKIISSSLPHPSCLTQYKDFVYWGDQQEGSITRASKYNGENRTMIEGNIGYIMDMKIFHNSRQVGWNECGNENGGCSHLCLALPGNKYTCACPNHYTLDEETKTTCISKYSLRDNKLNDSISTVSIQGSVVSKAFSLNGG
jgi:low density lipoprotein receptor-related protein 5/6